MRTALAAAVLALVAATAAAPARADHLPGFRESVRLSPRASMIVGKPVRVYCTSDRELWADTAIREIRGGGQAGARGFASVARGEAYLAPWVCQSLERWVRGKPVPLADFAEGLHTLIHESLHLRGIDDETAAECGSVREAAKWARTLFGVKRPATLRQVVAYVRADAAC